MKFVNTKAVVALKDGMVYALPFIIIGSIFLILKSFPIPAVSTFFDNIGWSVFFNQAYQTTFAIISIWTAIGIAYVYAKNEKLEPLPVGLTSLSVFFLLQSSKWMLRLSAQWQRAAPALRMLLARRFTRAHNWHIKFHNCLMQFKHI